MAATALQHQLNLQKATNNCAKTTVTETKVPGNTGGTLPVVGPTRRHEYDSERDGVSDQIQLSIFKSQKIESDSKCSCPHSLNLPMN